MATEITDEEFIAKSSAVLAEEEAALKAAHAQALAELNRIQSEALSKGNNLSPFEDYELYEVRGIGRYVIMRQPGWKALVNIIGNDSDQRSIVANIDFSANVYPAFDGIIGEHFQSPYLLDPLDGKYESYKDLRDNLAAVRNFLMQSYYATPAPGMTPAKAEQALAEIAGFVGDGLYNNWLFLGLVPNHNPTKPFIDLSQARKPNGEGAQYIYEKILEHQRHSTWMRPFAAVTALFGGKSQPDWQLPPASATPFMREGHYLADDHAPTAADAAAARVEHLESQLGAIQDARALSTVAVDLDAIGNHLLYTAQHMDGVAHISEPVRRDAVDIAKDILRKLKVSIGDLLIADGLQMKPSDDMATLGAVKGVAMVYERLMAWARGNNDSSIFQHPSVMAATQAIGQLGYLAKTEALRMAEIAGNSVMAQNIAEHLQRLPNVYATTRDMTFGSLLETIEHGMDTIINRTQQVSVTGAEVGFSVDNTLGSSLTAEPTAGIANQVGANNAAQRNAQAAVADQLATQAQAQRLHAQMASQARTQQNQNPSQPQQPAPPPVRGSTVGRQSLNTARVQQRQSSSAAVSTTQNQPTAIPLTPAQMQQAQRSAAVAAAAKAARERDEQLAREQNQLALQKANAVMAKAKATAQAIDPTLLKDFKAATNAAGLMGAPITGGRNITPQAIQASMTKVVTTAKANAQAAQNAANKPAAAGTTAPNQDPLKNPYTVQPPTPPRNGGGRGF